MENHEQVAAARGNQSGARAAQIELTDADLVAAMRQIPGYLDISIGDLLAIYRQAHRCALKRLSARGPGDDCRHA